MRQWRIRRIWSGLWCWGKPTDEEVEVSEGAMCIGMVVQSLENLEILEKSGNNILVRENLEKSGNFTERAKNVIGNNAFSYWNQALC